MPKKKWLRTVPLYDDDPEILSNLASNTKVCTKAFRFLCVGESHLAKGTECNCTQRPCKRAVSCTVWMCHRDTPWSARWLPLSQRLLCFHSCYSNKTIAVADGQQYPPLWSSRQEKGGGYFAANIQDRWQSDSRLVSLTENHLYICNQYYLQSGSWKHIFSAWPIPHWNLQPCFYLNIWGRWLTSSALSNTTYKYHLYIQVKVRLRLKISFF